jgi:hypothetical protein
MDSSRSLPVDLANRDDILAKLPEAEKILSLMERDLEEQQRERDRWRDLVDVLRSIAGTPNGDAHDPRPPATGNNPPSYSPMQDLVVGVVDREVRPIRAKEVAALLHAEGHDVSGDSVSNALWQASKENKRIQRLGRGVYAPLAYKEDPISLDSAAAGAATGSAFVHGSKGLY